MNGSEFEITVTKKLYSAATKILGFGYQYHGQDHSLKTLKWLREIAKAGVRGTGVMSIEKLRELGSSAVYLCEFVYTLAHVEEDAELRELAVAWATVAEELYAAGQGAAYLIASSDLQTPRT